MGLFRANKSKAKTNTVNKHPHKLEADQLAIYQVQRRSETPGNQEQIQGAAGLRVWTQDHQRLPGTSKMKSQKKTNFFPFISSSKTCSSNNAIDLRPLI